MAPPPPVRGVDEADMTGGLDMGEVHGLGLEPPDDSGCSKELVICETADGIFRGT